MVRTSVLPHRRIFLSFSLSLPSFPETNQQNEIYIKMSNEDRATTGANVRILPTEALRGDIVLLHLGGG